MAGNHARYIRITPTLLFRTPELLQAGRTLRPGSRNHFVAQARAPVICRMAARSAGSRGVAESASIRRLLQWKSSVDRARRPVRLL
jgi:hypothetical protein